jgi:hypothetical protein
LKCQQWIGFCRICSGLSVQVKFLAASGKITLDGKSFLSAMPELNKVVLTN